jgi:hypothetical protein
VPQPVREREHQQGARQMERTRQEIEKFAALMKEVAGD